MQGKIIILGKPNVGKSSLFNRLLRDKIAITSEVEGTTRDINIRPLLLGEVENPLCVDLCDSAGLMKKANGIFKNVKKMIFDFIKKDDLILYVISAEGGILEDDLHTFRALDSAILIVNKVDIEKNERWEYNAFGAKKIFYVSSLHNRGIKQLKDFLTLWAGNSVLGMQFHTCENFGESTDSSLVLSPKFSQIQKPHRNHFDCDSLRESTANQAKNAESALDSADSTTNAESANKSQQTIEGIAVEVVGFLDDFGRKARLKSAKHSKSPKSPQDAPKSKLQQDEFATINIGIIGRVNVGKSSILNALLGKERSLVSEIEGTTIDPVSDEIIYKDKILRFVDTAGIRRASKIEGIEKFALTRTKRILEQSNIALLVLDASSYFVELDEKISGLSQKYNLGIIILLNKWDIKCADFRAFSEIIKRKFAYLSYAPILTISALKMRHIDEIKATILRVWENFNRRIPTAQLNEHIKIATMRHPLPSERGKIVKVYYASQVDCAPPQIVLVMNRPRALHFSYKRYLVNYFRANFDFSGVPLVILSKGRGKDEIAE